MKNLIFTLIALFSQLVSAVQLDQLTYGEAASQLTLQKLQTAYKAMEPVTEESLPHETKDTRKQILAAREMLDLFAYSFKAGKGYEKIRKTLDEGYETIGHFKDLYDVQELADPTEAIYDDELVHERLGNVLAWKQKFIDARQDFTEFVQDVRQKGFSEHKQKNLSSQFWGISQVQPLAETPAQVAIGLLMQDLWHTAVDEYKIVKKISDPGKDTVNIEVYHDFRKRVRTALKIIQYFDEISAMVSAEQISVLTTMVERYGKISDLIAKAELLLEEKKDKKANKVFQEIKEQWNEVQHWEEDINLKSVLKSMTKINFSAQENEE